MKRTVVFLMATGLVTAAALALPGVTQGDDKDKSADRAGPPRGPRGPRDGRRPPPGPRPGDRGPGRHGPPRHLGPPPGGPNLVVLAIDDKKPADA